MDKEQQRLTTNGNSSSAAAADDSGASNGAASAPAAAATYGALSDLSTGTGAPAGEAEGNGPASNGVGDVYGEADGNGAVQGGLLGGDSNAISIAVSHGVAAADGVGGVCSRNRKNKSRPDGVFDMFFGTVQRRRHPGLDQQRHSVHFQIVRFFVFESHSFYPVPPSGVDV